MTEMAPNGTLRAVRMGMLMSQDDLARALREAGQRAGVPNDASKRLVQRWESGQVLTPHPRMARALEMVTGLPIASLGFSVPLPSARDTDNSAANETPGTQTPQGMPAAEPATRGNFSGVWLSRYEYFSSGRNASFLGLHYVVILQHGNRLTVRSLPNGSLNPDSPLTMDLTVDGNVVTGTWVEQTAVDGYYRGARYHGAIQMLVDPTGRRMTGRWVGFGAEMDVNTGPWDLIFQDASTNKATLAQYDRRPEESASKEIG